MKKGIDVSEHQGVIDWETVKASSEVNYVIIRAGYGREASQVDKQFERNYAECKRLGIPCGSYWYSYAVSEEEARKEAAVCLEILKGKQFEYPIYFDVEEPNAFATGNVDKIINAFCGELEKAGYWTGLYMSRSPLMQYVSESVRKRYALWVAEYNSVCNYHGSYGMWQKSSGGSIPGIVGNVDIDECYVDYPARIKASGKNGYTKPAKAAKKTQKAVKLVIDDHVYSGLLTEE